MNLIRILTIILIISLTKETYSCSCFFQDKVSILDVFETKYIFNGIVEETYLDSIDYVFQKYENHYDTMTFQALIVKFKVIKTYKGKVQKGIVKLSTAPDYGACGIAFKKGQTYNIWTNYYSDQYFSVDSCSRTTLISNHEKTQTFLLNNYKKKTTKKKWRDENNIIRGKGKYKDGIPDGFWKFYYNNGCLKTTGFFTKGEKEGKWTTYIDQHRDKNPNLILKVKKETKCETKPVRITTYREGRKINEEKISINSND